MAMPKSTLRQTQISKTIRAAQKQGLTIKRVRFDTNTGELCVEMGDEAPTTPEEMAREIAEADRHFGIKPKL